VFDRQADQEKLGSLRDALRLCCLHMVIFREGERLQLYSIVSNLKSK
jgi:hypothetical protein